MNFQYLLSAPLHLVIAGSVLAGLVLIFLVGFCLPAWRQGRILRKVLAALEGSALRDVKDPHKLDSAFPQITRWIDRQLDQAFPKVGDILSEMRLVLTFKALTFEMQKEPKFQSGVRVAYPDVGFDKPLSDFTGARSTLQPSLEGSER